MVRMKLWELLKGYENGHFKDGDIFIHQNHFSIRATFKSGSFVWCDDYLAISCKDITKDVWIPINDVTRQSNYTN
ncbi:hypothetical protein COI65_25445 [Bacillus wiedmannii]|uniref:Uncharacterized protein n=2 Tax=Bacillus wiedmannii TaxID=1890302 RepID=A0A2C5PF73_9BACI|nr:hypothetical protein COI65_25445 [Bacillus wiedmannii]